jgi:glycosyltransferase involved in cell wall biosynthesis
VKVAIVLDWITGDPRLAPRAHQKVLESWAVMYPDAEVFTLFNEPGSGIWRPSTESSALRKHVSALQRRRFLRKRVGWIAPAFASRFRGWFERLNLDRFDLVLSLGGSYPKASFAHRVSGSRHVSYLLGPVPDVAEIDADRIVVATEGIATSLKERAPAPLEVLPPPCRKPPPDFEAMRKPGRHFLLVSDLIRERDLEPVIQAFRQSSEFLYVVGAGPERGGLEKKAGRNTEFLGPLSDRAVWDLMAKARAVVIPAGDRTGTLAREAAAAGVPVIRFPEGGLPTLLPRESGEDFSARFSTIVNQVVR